MALTLDLTDDLAAREVTASSQPGFKGLAEVLEALAGLPTPEEVLALRPAPALEKRARDLLEKNRTKGLSPDEEREWERYEEYLTSTADGCCLQADLQSFGQHLDVGLVEHLVVTARDFMHVDSAGSQHPPSQQGIVEDLAERLDADEKGDLFRIKVGRVTPHRQAIRGGDV